ncbi:MAG: hypothetical protein HOL28_10540, partial [Crocinitomicaceae bacterium]|nr:hypothetical protein [Crocinitomicaceae bacterium]
MIEKIFCVVCFLLCINYHFGQEIPAQKELKSDVITIYDQDLLTATFHSERRQELRKRMAPNSVAIFLANPIRNRSNDINFEYHQDPNFYYFTGLNEPHALILIFKSPTKIDGKLVDEVVFMQEKDPETEVWDGKRYGTLGAQMILGIDLAKENQSFHKTKIDLNNFTSVYAGKIHSDIRDVPFKNGDLFDLRDKLIVKLDKVKEKQRNSELTMWCAELREKKTKEEMY